MKKVLIVLLLLFTWQLSTPDHAYAYIDPGSGSYIFQIIAGIILGGAITIKVYWKKITDFISRKPPKDNNNN